MAHLGTHLSQGHSQKLGMIEGKIRYVMEIHPQPIAGICKEAALIDQSVVGNTENRLPLIAINPGGARELFNNTIGEAGLPLDLAGRPTVELLFGSQASSRQRQLTLIGWFPTPHQPDLQLLFAESKNHALYNDAEPSVGISRLTGDTTRPRPSSVNHESQSTKLTGADSGPIARVTRVF